jgi:branched-chain amino acid transport system permease protein
LELLAQQLVNGLMAGSIYALVGLGLFLVYGLLDVLNFAQGQLVVLGGYLCFVLVTVAHVPFLLAIVIGMIAIAILAITLEGLVFRPVEATPINGLIVSIGVIGIVQSLLLLKAGTTPHPIPPLLPGTFQFGQVVFIDERLLILCVSGCLVAAFMVFLHVGRWGKAMRATLQNREAAILMGIPVRAITQLSFGVGGVLGAAAGGLLGTIVPVDPFTGDSVLLKGFIVLIVGGTTSPIGVVVASVALGIAEALGAGYISASAQDAFGFLILVVFLLVRPEGLLAERSARRA